MKRTCVLAVLVMLLCALVGPDGVRATQPPTLSEPIAPEHTVSTGNPIVFHIHFHDEQGDVPTEAEVKLTQPNGASAVATVQDLASVHNGSLMTFVYTPSQTGTYQYYYYVRDANGPGQYPAHAQLDFQVQPEWMPWAITVGGLLVSFLVITTLVYQVMHRAFGVKQNSSARVAIMVGALCAAIAVLFAWHWLSSIIAWIIAGIILVLLVVWAALAP